MNISVSQKTTHISGLIFPYLFNKRIKILYFISGNARTEIIIVAAPQTNSNVTLERSNIEIHVQFKNKTTLPPKRVKRDLSTRNENSDKEKYKDILDGDGMSKARDMVMKYNVPCNTGNTVEICKDLVTQFKSIGNMNIENVDDNKDHLLKLSSVANRDVEELTSTEKLKIRPLENIEMIRATPIIPSPFNGKETYEYAYESQGSGLSSPKHLHISPVADNCLLARVLKQKFSGAHSKLFILNLY